LAVVLLLPLQLVRAASQDEEARFLAAAKLAFEKHDADALAAIACWDGVPDKLKERGKKEYAGYVAPTVASVAFSAPSQKTHPKPPALEWKDDDGVVYRPNLPVTKHLNIAYAPGTTIESKTGKRKLSEIVLLVGERDGKLYLLQPAPAARQAPAQPPVDCGRWTVRVTCDVIPSMSHARDRVTRYYLKPKDRGEERLAYEMTRVYSKQVLTVLDDGTLLLGYGNDLTWVPREGQPRVEHLTLDGKEAHVVRAWPDGALVQPYRVSEAAPLYFAPIVSHSVAVKNARRVTDERGIPCNFHYMSHRHWFQREGDTLVWLNTRNSTSSAKSIDLYNLKDDKATSYPFVEDNVEMHDLVRGLVTIRQDSSYILVDMANGKRLGKSDTPTPLAVRDGKRFYLLRDKVPSPHGPADFMVTRYRLVAIDEPGQGQLDLRVLWENTVRTDNPKPEVTPEGIRVWEGDKPVVVPWPAGAKKTTSESTPRPSELFIRRLNPPWTAEEKAQLEAMLEAELQAAQTGQEFSFSGIEFPRISKEEAEKWRKEWAKEMAKSRADFLAAMQFIDPNAWGESANGLQARLKLKTTSQQPRASAVLVFHLRNTGDKPIRILKLSAQSRFWGECLPLKIRSSGAILKYQGPVLEPPSPPNESAYITLKPGDVDSTEATFVPEHWKLAVPFEAQAVLVFKQTLGEVKTVGPYDHEKKQWRTVGGLWTGEARSQAVRVKMVLGVETSGEEGSPHSGLKITSDQAANIAKKHLEGESFAKSFDAARMTVRYIPHYGSGKAPFACWMVDFAKVGTGEIMAGSGHWEIGVFT
jgi:hypothetical protein